MKHTPGPWRYYPHGGYCFFIHSESQPLAPRVATVSYTDGAHSFHEADARLIAAAPELLEALTVARETIADDLQVDLDSACRRGVEGAIDRSTADADMLDHIEAKEAVLATIDTALAKARGE